MKEKIKQVFLRVKALFVRPVSWLKAKINRKRDGGIDVAVNPNKKSLAKKAFSFLFYFIIALGLVELIFAVMIYGYRREDRVTRAVAAIVPYPVVISSFGFVSYDSYLAEKDYIHHFYTSTKQENVAYGEIDKQILDQLIENRLISYQAFRYGIKVKKEEIDQTFNSISEQNGGEEKVSKVLDDLYGLDVKSFKKLVREQLLRDKINDELIAKMTVRHILIRVDKSAPQDQVEAAKAKIDAILAEIKAGADFAETAKKKSEDIGSNEQGGELEPFAKGEMVEPFSNAAFATPVGQISDPVRSEFGWHIILVESRKGKIETTFTDWMADLKKNGFSWKLIHG